MVSHRLVSCAAGLWVCVGCAGGEQSLGGGSSSAPSAETEGSTADETSGAVSASTQGESSSATSDVTDPVLPGTPFGFDLAREVYIDLAGPSIVDSTNVSRKDWDLRFEGVEVFTNGGASGAGKGASFGPSTDLDLLFDTIPDVPLRADLSDGALLSWYWFGEEGVTSRFHVYGLRDGEGRLFKLQILDYYGTRGGERVSALYTLRYASVSEDGTGEVQELSNFDATAGGIDAPAGAPAGCLNLATGETFLLSEDEWVNDDRWHVCFQRTEVFINGGLSGSGDVVALDLEVDPETGEDRGLTEEEQQRTAATEATRFDAVGYDELMAASALWDKQYEVLPRIGLRWLQGTSTEPSPVPGTWFVRGADGERHYALFFTSVSPLTSNSPRVELQVKALVPR